MKVKRLMLCLVLVLVLSFVPACSEAPVEETMEKEEVIIETEPVEEPIKEAEPETTTTIQPTVNPLDVPEDGVLWDGDEKIVSYFTENVESYLNEKYLIQYNGTVSMMGFLVIDYSSKKDESVPISKENWDILNELLKFQPSQHAIAFLIKGNDGNEYGSYINLFDAKEITDGNSDYDSWEISCFFKSGDNSEAESKQKEAIESMEELVDLADQYTANEELIEELEEEERVDATLGEKNAAKKALDYLAYTPFSYSGLVEQLKFEGYTHEEAVYGVDKCGADWKE